MTSTVISNLTLKVAGYHINSRSVVNITQLLWWIEQGRSIALFSRVEDDPATIYNLLFEALLKLGLKVVVRAQQHHFVHDIHYDDTLSLYSHLAQVGKSSMTVVTEMYQTDPRKVFNTCGLTSFDQISEQSDKLLGYSSATLVFIDSSNRPFTIPKEISEHLKSLCRPPRYTISLFPNQVALGKTQISDAEGAYFFDFVVKSSDIDYLQHLNHSKYMQYFDDTRMIAALADYFSKFGVDSEALKSYEVRKLRLDHLGQAFLNTKIRVYMKLIQIHPEFVFDFEMRDQDSQGSVYARARVSYTPQNVMPLPQSKL